MKFIKKNFLFIICLCLGIITLFSINSGINERIAMEDKGLVNLKNNCLKNYNHYQGEAKATCDKIINGEVVNTRKNFYIKFSEVQTENIRNLAILCPLILIIISSYEVNTIFKSKIALLMLKRESYFTFLKKVFKKMYRYVFMFPVFMLLIFLICSLNSSFDTKTVLNSLLVFGDLKTGPVFYVVAYIINILLFSAFYLNLTLIVMRKQHNYFLLVIESFLLLIAIQLFLEVVVNGIIFNKIINSSIGLVFNILNGFTFNLANASIPITLLFSFSCFIITSIIVYLRYKNKEQLVIDCEKNN